MDAQELVAVAATEGLSLERREKCLEPFERRSVFADPDEFHAAETLGWVRRETLVVNRFQNGSPGCDADTSTDEDGDFVLENVFGWSTVWAVDLERRHLLAVLKRDLVHAHGIKLIVELRL